jgi:hypothetical protein
MLPVICRNAELQDALQNSASASLLNQICRFTVAENQFANQRR